jgi:malate dehydrogenase (quinone)
MKTHPKKVDSLRTFMPTAKDEDWTLIDAGQRAQVMKKDPKKGGVLQFGTEVIASGDGSIAGLLGASPGASTAVPIMLDLLKRCFPGEFPAWEPQLRALIPTFGEKLNSDPARAEESTAATAAVLGINA